MFFPLKPDEHRNMVLYWWNSLFQIYALLDTYVMKQLCLFFLYKLITSASASFNIRHTTSNQYKISWHVKSWLNGCFNFKSMLTIIHFWNTNTYQYMVIDVCKIHMSKGGTCFSFIYIFVKITTLTQAKYMHTLNHVVFE